MSDETPANVDTVAPLSHPDIIYTPSTQILAITLPFDTHSTKYYLTPAFATWHTSFLAALKSHSISSLSTHSPSKLTIILHLVFPSSSTHTISNQRAQRSLLAELVRVFNTLDSSFTEDRVGKFDIVMKVTKGKVEWTQVKVLAPFWGLRGGYGNGRWRLFLKEGEAKAKVVRAGDEWEVRLRGEYRGLVERWEL